MMDDVKQQAQFSERNDYEERRASRNQNEAAQKKYGAAGGPYGVGGLESVKSVDRKTFTLGEKGPNGLMSGQGAITSKTDK